MKQLPTLARIGHGLAFNVAATPQPPFVPDDPVAACALDVPEESVALGSLDASEVMAPPSPGNVRALASKPSPASPGAIQIPRAYDGDVWVPLMLPPPPANPTTLHMPPSGHGNPTSSSAHDPEGIDTHAPQAVDDVAGRGSTSRAGKISLGIDIRGSRCRR